MAEAIAGFAFAHTNLGLGFFFSPANHQLFTTSLLEAKLFSLVCRAKMGSAGCTLLEGSTGRQDGGRAVPVSSVRSCQ